MVYGVKINWAELNPEKAAFLRDCSRSLRLFSKAFLPHRFNLPFSPSHEALFQALDNDRLHRVVCQASRDFGKTTIVSFAYVIQNIIFDKRKFIVIVCANKERAEERSDDIRSELLTNEQLIALMGGPIHTERKSLSRGKFKINCWQTIYDDALIFLGAEQESRGANIRGWRPSLVILDDYERSSEVQNEDIRKKRRKNIMADLRYMFDSAFPLNKMVIIGTPQHHDSIVVNLKNRTSWHSIEMPIADAALNSHWPEKISTEKIRQEYKEASEDHETHLFYQERMCKIQDPEKAVWKPELFHYLDEINVTDYDLNTNPDVTTMVMLDPSRSDDPKSDLTGLVAVSIHRYKHHIYVRRCFNGHLMPNEMYEKAFAMCREVHARYLCPEEQGLKFFLRQMLENYQRQHGFTDVQLHYTNSGNVPKEMRVRELHKYYSQGECFHNRAQCMALESQLLQFPTPTDWSLCDPLAYINKVCQELKLFFIKDYGDEARSEEDDDPWVMDARDEQRLMNQMWNEEAIPYRRYACA